MFDGERNVEEKLCIVVAGVLFHRVIHLINEKMINLHWVKLPLPMYLLSIINYLPHVQRNILQSLILKSTNLLITKLNLD